MKPNHFLVHISVLFIFITSSAQFPGVAPGVFMKRNSPPSYTGGYFVLSDSIWGANMGGLSGANGLCLTELTNKDWMGKADASSRGLIDSSHVRAFLCGATCNTLIANTTYQFAVANNISIGGAQFTTDGSGAGPGDSNVWSGSTYFGTGGARYWSGRDVGTATLWANTPHGSASIYRCSEWTSTSMFNGGERGASDKTDAKRWGTDSVESCSSGNNALICYVNP